MPPTEMRADARRNRDRILAAANEAFAEAGVGVPVDEIARRAGVGAGTLYRHFPTKEALFEAVLVEHFEALLEKARHPQEGRGPADALFDFLGILTDEGASKRNLVDALAGAGIDFKANTSDTKVALDEVLQRMLSRAQAAGEIRSDISLADVMGLTIGACMYAGEDETGGSPGRMISVICAGLRTP